MKKRLQELEDLIIRHKNLYYQGKAEISDEEYDALEEELLNTYPESPVLQMVGAKKLQKAKIKHDKKMLSLEKTYDEEKLKAWIDGHEVISMYKYDGSACSLIYENNTLVTAKTRGDGEFGEDILSKVIFIKDIPKRLTNSGEEKIEVRGEVYCTEENFLELSKEMKNKKLETPNSIRNIVAGILGRKDHVDLSRYLSFSAFEILSKSEYISEGEKFKELKRMNFKVPEIKICKKWTDVQSEIEKVKRFFTDGEFLIDGLVFVYNDITFSKELGETSHHPKNKIAFKFKGESKITTLKNIEWNISRNGRCTPVGIVDPIELSGALVSRVTLHHLGIVETFQLKSGDKIEIIRSGEVIPKFIRVVESSKSELEIPNTCPSCNHKLIKEEHWLVCENTHCPEKVLQEILYFIKSLGIEEISFMRLKEMLSSGLINKNSPLKSLFSLKKEDFLKLDKVKEKLALKFEEQIKKARIVSLQSFMVSLGIEGLGATKVQKIIDAGYTSLKKILNLKFEEIIQIEGFAELTAKAIIQGLEEKSKMITELLDAGVRVLDAQTTSNNIEKEKLRLYNLKICITGTLSKPRNEIEKLIRENGGILQDSVNKETKYLVTNDIDSNSSKFVKAKKLNIPIINENELNNLIEKK